MVQSGHELILFLVSGARNRGRMENVDSFFKSSLFLKSILDFKDYCYITYKLALWEEINIKITFVLFRLVAWWQVLFLLYSVWGSGVDLADACPKPGEIPVSSVPFLKRAKLISIFCIISEKHSSVLPSWPYHSGQQHPGQPVSYASCESLDLKWKYHNSQG